MREIKEGNIPSWKEVYKKRIESNRLLIACFAFPEKSAWSDHSFLQHAGRKAGSWLWQTTLEFAAAELLLWEHGLLDDEMLGKMRDLLVETVNNEIQMYDARILKVEIFTVIHERLGSIEKLNGKQTVEVAGEQAEYSSVVEEYLSTILGSDKLRQSIPGIMALATGIGLASYSVDQMSRIIDEFGLDNAVTAIPEIVLVAIVCGLIANLATKDMRLKNSIRGLATATGSVIGLLSSTLVNHNLEIMAREVAALIPVVFSLPLINIALNMIDKAVRKVELEKHKKVNADFSLQVQDEYNQLLKKCLMVD